MSNIVYIGGDHDFLRKRFVRKTIQSELLNGRKLLSLNGRNEATIFDIEQAITNTILFNQELIIHITNTEHLSNYLFVEHLSDDTVLVLLESKKKTHPKAVKIPKKFIKIFSEPPFYKLEEQAAEFFVKEITSRGCTIRSALAKSIVQWVGADLGVLAFEAMKMSSFAPNTEINLETIKATLAPLSEIGPDRIIHSLSIMDSKQLLRSMRIYRKHQKYDPTIVLCGKFLSPIFFKWLQASSSPYTSKKTVEKVGGNFWYWKNKIAPPANTWGVEGIYKLIKAVSDAQTAVHRGSLSPWTILETGLIQACSR